MADIFISYKREDRLVAQRLSTALEQLGFDVWWDFDLLSGDAYRKVIRNVIDQCTVAIVLWSERAVESDFVVDEASHAKAQNKLCPARIDATPLPFGFGSIHTDDLANWNGELSHPGFQALVRGLEGRLGRAGRLGAQRSAQAQAEHAELEAFKAAQLACNETALRAFLRAHPHGVFASFVRGQLETITSHVASAQSQVGAPKMGTLWLSVLSFAGAIAAVETWYIPAVWESRHMIGVPFPGTGYDGVEPYFIGLPDLAQIALSVIAGSLGIRALTGSKPTPAVLLLLLCTSVVVWMIASFMASSAVQASANPTPQLFFHLLNVLTPAATALAAFLAANQRRSTVT